MISEETDQSGCDICSQSQTQRSAANETRTHRRRAACPRALAVESVSQPDLAMVRVLRTGRRETRCPDWQ